MPVVDCVFVYGTLMRGLPESKLLNDLGAEFVDLGHVHGRLYVSDFPRLVAGSDAVVRGEVYRFSDPEAALVELDRFEREGKLYSRTLLEVTTSRGPVTAWGYVSREVPPGVPWVPDGNYRSYLFNAMDVAHNQNTVRRS